MSEDTGTGAGETLRQIATNLFHGYGYTYYRTENELRADDQRIRRMVSELLQRSRKALSEAEARYRRERFPAPSRAQPFPPPEAQADARRLEALAGAVSALDGQIAHLPVPGNDFMTQRYRNEAETLRQLAEKDVELAEAAHGLLTLVEGLDLGAILPAASQIENAIEALRRKILERQTLLV
ncbi:hypothetical protein [Novosphingobium terrae]|uniref:hypothetical protein n=1 Tax=Novosphingobium terrae TaxID=2726189 RepID=UPI00197EFA28|nr:hypothetical protein [Novosphingobium terrae]